MEKIPLDSQKRPPKTDVDSPGYHPQEPSLNGAHHGYAAVSVSWPGCGFSVSLAGLFLFFEWDH